jgi:anaerobic carbon-monoxide dehydrogenase iron sulfur subunit
MKWISVLPDVCTGCESCELVCSLAHEGASCPSLSRIQVKKWGEIALSLPIVCQQCEDPPCMTICPTKARKRIPETGAVVTDEKWCVGCKSCIYACPFSAPVLHPKKGKTMTCDLCGGKPLCVEACTAGALHYTYDGKPAVDRKKFLGQQLLQQIRVG